MKTQTLCPLCYRNHFEWRLRHGNRNLNGPSQRIKIPVRAAAQVGWLRREAGKVADIDVDPGDAVARKLVGNLIPATDRGLVASPVRRRPCKPNRGCPVVTVARPDTLIGIGCTLTNQDRFRQRGFVSTSGHPVVDAAARYAV